MKWMIYLIFIGVFPCHSQEVFFKDQEILHDIPPDYFYLHGQGKNFDTVTNYMAKGEDYNASYSQPEAVVKKVGRNFHNHTAIGLSNENVHMVIPGKVTDEILNAGNGFTLSGWFYAADINADRAVAYIGDPYNADVDIILKERKVVVRKRSKINPGLMLPVIESAFPLEYNEYTPTAGDITNGYFYLAIASDAKSTRIYLSRPGGRLYSQWFYFSLMDVFSRSDKIYFGKAPKISSELKIMDAYSNIMIYRKALSSNEALNAFYLQSPLYPGVSYRFINNNLRDLVPSQADNQSGKFDDDGFFKWQERGNNVNGVLSSARWFIDSRTKGSGKFIPVNLRNARTGGYVYQKTGSDYFYQLLFPAENYAERTTFYMEKLEENPKSLYSQQGSGNIKFWSAHDPRYWLGNNNNNLYLDDNEENGRWSITSATKVYHGADIFLPPRGHRVKLRNLGRFESEEKGARTYVNIYSGASYYYAKLDKYSVSRPDISGVVNFSFRWLSPSDYGIYNKYIFRGVSDYGLMQPYYGKTDKSENDYVITDDNQGNFYWEVITIDAAALDKTKVGDRNFYAIRASNGYGSFLLGRKDGYCPGGSSLCYVLKSGAGAYDSDGTPKRDFLWIIDYMNSN